MALCSGIYNASGSLLEHSQLAIFMTTIQMAFNENS